MRSLVALLAGLFLLANARSVLAQNDVSALAQGNNQFAFDLYARLAQTPGNKFFSPYSISTALGMTYAGAKGQTAQEMAQTLHLPAGEDASTAFGELIRKLQGPAKERPFQLHTANRLWGQLGMAIRPEFLQTTQTQFQAGLQLVDFKKDFDGSRKLINKWVEDQTNDKIKDLLKPGALDDMTRLVLTNAIYFKGDWVVPFPKEGTRPEDFTIPGTPAFKVPMMTEVLTTNFVNADGFQIVQLPYKGNEVSMLVILPKKSDGLAALEKNLSAKWLQQTIASGKPARVLVKMPKFKMTEEFSLKNELVALGMKLAFSDNADFSGITTNSADNLKIDKVIHKAFVAVDEKGTEAAAATAVVMVTLSGKPQPPIPFTADHPFLFAIQHNATGSILFLGRVHDPR